MNFDSLELPIEGVAKLQELSRSEGESITKFDRRFKEVVRRLEEPLNDKQNMEWFILTLTRKLWMTLEGRYFVAYSEFITLACSIEIQSW